MDTLTNDMPRWVARLSGQPLPVLRSTVAAINAFARDPESVSAHQVSEVVLRDPLLTLKLLRYLQQHRRASQDTDVTTIAHALMMVGLDRFFRDFRGQTALEDLLSPHPLALNGALQVVSRARHAALCARDWARIRHDIEMDEVMVAALLHDLAELLIWCFEPEIMLKIKYLQESGVAVRSVEAQRAVLGFALLDLQLALAEAWLMPRLLHDLMDDHHAGKPRVRNVVLAVQAARHCAHGWDDPALADDYSEIAQVLDISKHDVHKSVVRTALAAAREWRLFGVLPAAAMLPLIYGGGGRLK